MFESLFSLFSSGKMINYSNLHVNFTVEETTRMSFKALKFQRTRDLPLIEPDFSINERTLIGSFVYTRNESENFGEYIYNQIRWILWYHHRKNSESFYVLEDPIGLYSRKLGFTGTKFLERSVWKLYDQIDHPYRGIPETTFDPYEISKKILFEIQTHQKALQEIAEISESIESTGVLISDLIPIVSEYLTPKTSNKRTYFVEVDFVEPQSGEVGGVIESYELETRCSLPFQNEYFVLHCTKGPFNCWFDGYKEQIHFVDPGFEKDLEDETYFINVVQQNK
jgi:hypothetical protein